MLKDAPHDNMVEVSGARVEWLASGSTRASAVVAPIAEWNKEQSERKRTKAWPQNWLC